MAVEERERVGAFCGDADTGTRCGEGHLNDGGAGAEDGDKQFVGDERGVRVLNATTGPEADVGRFDGLALECLLPRVTRFGHGCTPQTVIICARISVICTQIVGGVGAGQEGKGEYVYTD
ncbi:hypothetical protein ACGFWG_28205 [Streptomyces sp. NPDC048405]|uniref:hypothetical protein n=1 Tax=Streptomyces sp. NPDC048405 TaxID=3365544 RepID=UPI00371F483B